MRASTLSCSDWSKATGCLVGKPPSTTNVPVGNLSDPPPYSNLSVSGLRKHLPKVTLDFGLDSRKGWGTNKQCPPPTEGAVAGGGINSDSASLEELIVLLPS